MRGGRSGACRLSWGEKSSTDFSQQRRLLKKVKQIYYIKLKAVWCTLAGPNTVAARSAACTSQRQCTSPQLVSSEARARESEGTMKGWTPESSYVGIFMSYTFVDICIVLLCLWWLLRGFCARVASQVRRPSFVSSSTHPLYFEAPDATPQELYDDSPGGFMFASRSAQLCSVGSRLLLVTMAVIVTLQAGTLTLGAYFSKERLQQGFVHNVFVVQALHTLLVPMLLYLPLSWCMSLGPHRMRCPASCLGRMLVLGTVLLSSALLAAGVAGIASHDSQLHAEDHFGVVVWRNSGTWTLGGTELGLLSPLVLALYTCAAGVCLWWRCGIRSTVLVQVLLLGGHFAVSVNSTAAFFVPNAWQSIFLLSLLHTDWLLWRREDKAATEAAAQGAEARGATYAALLASHQQAEPRMYSGESDQGSTFSQRGIYIAPSPAGAGTPGSLQWGGSPPLRGGVGSPSRQGREVAY